MTTRITAPLALMLVLAACGGNPFLQPGVEPEPDPTELPGTENPTPDSGITRYEPTSDDAVHQGDGFAQDFTFDVASNTYTVDNLGFDGANGYTQPAGAAVATLGSYNVYEASATETDPQTGVPISQFQHRLLAGVSRTGRTEFAIVRTGAYRDFGFGGFVLKRNDNVVLPTTGQAAYAGDYAGVRDFSGSRGLEYVTGNMEIAIDFEDFNDGSAVTGVVTDRRIRDVNNRDITPQILAAMDEKFDPSSDILPDGKVPASTELPELLFSVGPGVIDANGEIRGFLDSTVTDYRGDRPAPVVYEEGKYYAIVSGENADEVVGVIVVESEDPRADGVIARETGGFILYRP